MKRKKAIAYYGKEMWKKMEESGELDGITYTKLPCGEIDIPFRDLERAWNAVLRKQEESKKGERIKQNDKTKTQISRGGCI
jgi:hypothetical protein